MGCPHLHGLLLLTTQASAGLCRYSIPDGPPQPLHPDDAALLAVRGTAAAAAARCQAAGARVGIAELVDLDGVTPCIGRACHTQADEEASAKQARLRGEAGEVSWVSLGHE